MRTVPARHRDIDTSRRAMTSALYLTCPCVCILYLLFIVCLWCIYVF